MSELLNSFNSFIFYFEFYDDITRNYRFAGAVAN